MGIIENGFPAIPCKIAVIGAGSMAREHIRAFRDIPGATLVGIYSRTRERAETLASEYGIPLVCNSITELFENTNADLVVVTVVELSMNKVSKACFEFPWTILLEKPAGYNMADARDIFTSSKEKHSKVFVALNRRFYSSTRSAREQVNKLEGQRYIRVQDQQNQVDALRSGQPKLVVDNWMYANTIHLIDYLRVFGRGTVKHVEQICPWNPENPGLVISRVDFSSGDIGLYEGVWNGPGPWAVNIQSPLERWELRPLEQAIFQRRGERILNPVPAHPWDKEFKPGFRLQAQMAVLAAMGMPSELPTLSEAMETMRLIESIFGHQVARPKLRRLQKTNSSKR